MKYLPIIGLEIHVQLKTKTKMFCSCPNFSENLEPNTAVCPICLGHPGTLPVPNETALDFAIKTALALNCKILSNSKFDRKNYFYPDLPKGYQISQYDMPIGENGYLKIFSGDKENVIGITRLHLEEDAAKLIHSEQGNYSLIDFNRGGTPLIEIVTEPDFRSSEDARLFLQELKMILRYLDISDADMEKGHLRCDANISLRPKGMNALFPKTEIKNLNSFKAVERALNYEYERQSNLWELGEPPSIASTRGWDDKKQITEEQRTKEESEDYRYFPEPDIPLFKIPRDKVKKIKSELPELPRDKRIRFLTEYAMDLDSVNLIIENIDMANYTERVISELRDWVYTLDISKGTQEETWESEKPVLVKLYCGWFLNKLPNLLVKKGSDFYKMDISPENFAEFISLVYKQAINSTAAQQILEKMIASKSDPSHLMEEMGLAQIDNMAVIENIIQHVIENNPGQVNEYKSGKKPVIQYLLGQVMKESKGKVNPKIAMEILEKKLK